jgi:CPA2 family monovalent cation:H+ antiporter-2
VAAPVEISGSGFSDALTILGAAGIVIPTFARLKITPVIGFIIVGIIAGPFALGALAPQYPWLDALSISDPEGIQPFAELGIILLLFSAGLHVSFRRLKAMRRTVFVIGGGELLGCAALISLGLLVAQWPPHSAIAVGLALALSSTALVLPISGTEGPVGRSAFAMLLFEDLALVPMLFAVEVLGGRADGDDFMRTALLGLAVVAAMLVIGRYALPVLFSQAARTKSPELFLAISLLTVILAAIATGAVGLSPILGALIAGILIGETDYHAEVEAITAPLAGLALGIFLITVGMRIDVADLLSNLGEILMAVVGVLAIKALVTAALLRWSGLRTGAAVETGLMMASPSETSLIVLTAAAASGLLRQETSDFWTTVTALGLTITPLLAAVGRRLARRVERRIEDVPTETAEGRTVLFGFGRVGQIVADMLVEHKKPFIAVDSDVDSVRRARDRGYPVLYGDVGRQEFAEQMRIGSASALVLTMDDPVLVARIARRLRDAHPDLPIIARARDTGHAATLYKAGVTDAVPETLEASLQLAEAVLVDIGVAMGPVIASIHEKRSQQRAEIMNKGDLEEEPSLGRRRLRDRFQPAEGSNRKTPAT